MAQAFTDRWGSPVFAGRQQAVDLLDEAVEQLVSLSGDPVAFADEAAAARSTARACPRPAGLPRPVLRARHRDSRRRGPSWATSIRWSLETGERELLHVLAVQSWADGEWERAVSFLERALLHESRDLLALKVAQDLYFFIGNQLDLRDVVERVFGAWPSDRPGYGYVCGMYAFGLEENGQYEAAEEQARSALGGESPRRVGCACAGPCLRDAREPSVSGSRSWTAPSTTGPPATSPPTTGGTARSTTLSFERSTRPGPLRRPYPRHPVERVARRGRRGLVALAPAPLRESTSAIVPEHCSRTSRGCWRTRVRVQRLARGDDRRTGRRSGSVRATRPAGPERGRGDQSPRHRSSWSPTPRGLRRLRQR